ncbi:hypothetical protein Lfu02_75370 [Longispora fulva]|uniref:Glycosyltransferase 2-like domain-containing protein n=1 Tax=Longispora fulva TaxID=619741 RepID=A0A8J7KK68_9ACTN|nr:glycosyltransferase family 2 protein [Longispora fulva]MBG6136326.1 hypothetical protein [Longispora fulva]GIG63165.1 hypothetical protein Lfu02_75370 [Longispora fulva]
MSASSRSSRTALAGLLLAAGITGRHAVGLLELRRSRRALIRPACPDPIDVPAPTVHLVVPVLREQQAVASLLDWCATLLEALPSLTLTVVTTAREDAERQLLAEQIAAAGPGALRAGRFPLTADECQALAAVRPTTTGEVAAVLDGFLSTRDVVVGLLAEPALAKLPIGHLHHPGVEGRKAAQVNHAAEQIPAGDETESYLAVFDVDSRPTVEQMTLILRELASHRQRAGSWPEIMQQSALFTAPAGSGALAHGAARMQSLWTLRRELASFRRYRAGLDRYPAGFRRTVVRGLAQTVGHGLLVRRDVFAQVGGLPTSTTLDDFPFGFQVTMAGVPVRSAPMLGRAPMPDTLTELVRQGRRWFNNYLDYPRCARDATAAGRGRPVERAVALAVGGYRGTGWLLRGPAALTLLGLAVSRTGWPTRLTAAAGLVVGFVEPARQLARLEDRPADPLSVAHDSVDLFCATVLNSVGPAWAVAARLAGARTALSPKAHRITGEAS